MNLWQAIQMPSGKAEKRPKTPSKAPRLALNSSRTCSHFCRKSLAQNVEKLKITRTEINLSDTTWCNDATNPSRCLRLCIRHISVQLVQEADAQTCPKKKCTSVHQGWELGNFGNHALPCLTHSPQLFERYHRWTFLSALCAGPQSAQSAHLTQTQTSQPTFITLSSCSSSMILGQVAWRGFS